MFQDWENIGDIIESHSSQINESFSHLFLMLVKLIIIKIIYS